MDYFKEEQALICNICGTLVTFHQYENHINQCKELLIARQAIKDRQDKKIFNNPADPAMPSSLLQSFSRYNFPSNEIDTNSKQMSVCPHCFEELGFSKLRSHINNYCPEKKIICLDCQSAFSSSFMKEHIAKECSGAKKRRLLAQRAVTRKILSANTITASNNIEPIIEYEGELSNQKISNQLENFETPSVDVNETSNNEAAQQHVSICDKCGISIRSSKMPTHLMKECKYRLVYCPNRRLGCEMEMALNGITRHLNSGFCVVEERKLELISQSEQRLEQVACPACGELQQLRYLKKHEVEQCDNRRVNCRNQCLGCSVMVRVKDRAKHEHVDGQRSIRRCICFGNEGVYLDINEDDIACPAWTAEFWIFRSSMQDAAKAAIRRMHRLLPAFISACNIEQQVARLVDMHISCLRDNTPDPLPALADKDKSDSTEFSSALSTGEERMAIVTRLQSLVVIYDDAVLASCSAAQLLGIAVSAAYSAMEEMQSSLPGYLGDISISLVPKETCETDREYFDAYNEQRKQAEEADRRNAQAMIDDLMKFKAKTSASSSLSNSISSVSSNNPRRSPTPSITGSFSAPDKTRNSSIGKTSSSSSYTAGSVVSALSNVDIDIAADAVSGVLVEVEVDVVYEGDPAMKASDQLEEEKEGLKLLDASDESFARDEIEEDERKVTNITKKVDEEKDLEDVSARLLNKFEYPGLGFLLSKHKTFSRFEAEVFSKHLKAQRHVMATTGSGGKSNNKKKLLVEKDFTFARGFFSHETLAIAENIHPKKDKYGRLVEEPPRVNKDFQFTWMQWETIVHVLEASIDYDLNLLQQWRLSSNLLEDFVSREKVKEASSTGKNAELTKEQIQAQKKKEKSKKRREISKQKKQLSGNENEEDGDDGNSNGKKKLQEKGRGKLLTRMMAMFRSNFGNDVVMSSSSIGGGGGRSKLSLEFYSGLIFDALKFLAQADAGAMSVVDNINLDNSNSDANADVDQNGINGSGGVGFLCNTSTLASSAGSLFKVRVPRAQWCHIVVVATTQPRNRMLLYKDGMLIGQSKDLAVPLPMGYIGEPDMFSFHGAILDVRYWAKQRSGLEIQRSMHKVIDVDDIVNPKDYKQQNQKSSSLKISLKHIENTNSLDSGNEEAKLVISDIPKKSMRKLAATPQLDLSCKGLIAYWTFEDDKSSVQVTDVTLQRFKVKVLMMNYTDNKTMSNRYSPPDVSRYLPPMYRNAPMDDGSTIVTLSPDANESKEEEDTTITNGAIVAMRESSVALMKRGFVWVDASTLVLPSLNSTSSTAATSTSGNAIEVDSDVLIPVPSFNLKNKCEFEIKRFKLATRGRALQKEINCPLGCSEKIRGMDVRFHVKFDCIRRRVSCRIPFCKASFPLQEQQRHESLYCEYIQRRQGLLEQAADANVLRVCELCGDSQIKARDSDKHSEQECPHRVISCPNPGCDCKFQEHMFEAHNKYECESSVLKYRYFLVSRARSRLNYPRPWGLEFCIPSSRGVGDEGQGLRERRSASAQSSSRNREIDESSINDSDVDADSDEDRNSPRKTNNGVWL